MDLWIPNPKQLLLLNSTKKYLDAKGDPRSGKSEVFYHKAYDLCLLERGIRILVTRDTGTQLSTASYNHFINVCADNAIDWNESKTRPYPVVKFKTGSEVHFIPLDEMDTTKAGSSEYAVVFMEEAHRLSLRQWAYYQRRLSQQWGKAIGPDGRVYRNKITYRGLWTARNAAGHNWAWQIFTRDHPGAEDGTDPKFLSVRFVMTDNAGNLPTDYMEDIEDLPLHMQKQYKGGEEEPEQGLVFPHFDRRIHVVSKMGTHDFLPPYHWRILGGHDHGYKNPTQFDWGAVTEEGFVIIFREYRGVGLTIPANAANILAEQASLEAAGMGQIESAWVDPSTHMRDGRTASGMTTYEQYLAEGMKFLYLPPRLHLKDRIDMVARALLPNKNRKKHPITGVYREAGWPRLMFTENCKETIREFEEWEWTPQTTARKDPSETPQEKNDHAVDAVMYILAGAGETMVAPELDLTQDYPKTLENYWIKQAIDKDIEEFDVRRQYGERRRLHR